jgi:hypothetical protein
MLRRGVLEAGSHRAARTAGPAADLPDRQSGNRSSNMTGHIGMKAAVTKN